MVICNECGKQVKLICRECQVKRTRRGMLLHQRRFLQTWIVGAIKLRVKHSHGELHLELFDDRWHSYCDREMFDATAREYVTDLPADLCGECVKVFQEQVGIARAAMR